MDVFMNMDVCMDVCMYGCICMDVNSWMHVCSMYGCIRVCMDVYVWMGDYMYVWVN